MTALGIFYLVLRFTFLYLMLFTLTTHCNQTYLYYRLVILLELSLWFVMTEERTLRLVYVSHTPSTSPLNVTGFSVVSGFESHVYVCMLHCSASSDLYFNTIISRATIILELRTYYTTIISFTFIFVINVVRVCQILLGCLQYFCLNILETYLNTI